MNSNISLYIEIEHEENLDLDASQIAAAVAQSLATTLGVLPIGMVESIKSGRRTTSGGVTVTLNSAAITSQRPCECREAMALGEHVDLAAHKRHLFPTSLD